MSPGVCGWPAESRCYVECTVSRKYKGYIKPVDLLDVVTLSLEELLESPCSIE